MQKKLFLLVLAVGILLGFAGCTTFTATGLEATANFAPPAADDAELVFAGTFERAIWVNRFLGAAAGPTLGNIGTAAMNTQINNAIQEEIQRFGGREARNITIEHTARFHHLLLNIFWIYAPSQVTIRGTVFR
ncbi:MAG: hypothetical protein FWG66_00100 [Spirochaetes bacterium]|nr:hypothetical protein [Spirochaetota bacterium]